MKDGVIFVNLSRGFVVDIPALKEALISGKLSGAAVDVFPVEPRANGAFETELKGIPNVILTPHIGAQTKEAQSLAANVIGEKIIQILRGVI